MATDLHKLLALGVLGGAGLALGGCFDPTYEDGTIHCEVDGCPSGLFCAADGLCYRDPTQVDTGDVVDEDEEPTADASPDCGFTVDIPEPRIIYDPVYGWSAYVLRGPTTDSTFDIRVDSAGENCDLMANGKLLARTDCHDDVAIRGSQLGAGEVELELLVRNSRNGTVSCSQRINVGYPRPCGIDSSLSETFVHANYRLIEYFMGTWLWHFTYDENNRLIHIAKDWDGNGTDDDFTTILYDDSGLPMSVATQGEFPSIHTLSYDDQGRIITRDIVATFSTTEHYSYDADGRLESITAPYGDSSIIRTFTYDDAGLLATADVKSPSTGLVTTYDYDYDALGNLTSCEVKSGTSSTTWSFNYDCFRAAGE